MVALAACSIAFPFLVSGVTEEIRCAVFDKYYYCSGLCFESYPIARQLTKLVTMMSCASCFLPLCQPSLQLGSVLLKASTTNARKFEMEYTNERRGFQSETIRASLKQLITFVTSWTHLFPDTPKQEALAGVQERQL